MSFRNVIGVFATLAVGFVIGCGSGGSGSAGSGSSGSTHSESFSCCINGSYYQCPSQSASDQCFMNGSPGSCSRDSSQDSTCTH